ncbi:hypothetical protein ACKI14_02535 [Streptomyces turgidiscabies]|uniref:hypothetical protein n=1 Tax=Streptomyces turgidiscabies TaxID=85558 RepID=UPI0038F6F651
MGHRTDPQQPAHDPRACKLCAVGRHPAQAQQRRALREHLKTNPLPRQAAGR